MSQVLKLILIWAPILFIGFVIYSVCYGRMLVQRDLPKSQKWFPSYSEGYLQKTELSIRPDITEGEAKNIQAEIILGLKKRPLSHMPFFQMGQISLFLKDVTRARVMYSEALERNIRDIRTLRSMVNLSYIDRNFSKSIELLDNLLTLDGIETRQEDYHENYHDALIYLTGDKDASEIVDSYLVSRPKWAWQHLFKRIGNMTGNNFFDVGDAVQKFSSRNSSYVADKNLHNFYLKKLKNIGKIDEAYLYWLKLTDNFGKHESYTVFNPTFDQRDELPPFNWMEVEETEYYSEIDTDGGLYASYAGDKGRVLTEQLLRLNPGQKYRMAIEGEWSYRSQEGVFYWTIICLESKKTISQVDFDDTTKDTSGGVQDFQVPIMGCEFQNVRLRAKSGQYSKRIWSKTNSLNISLLH